MLLYDHLTLFSTTLGPLSLIYLPSLINHIIVTGHGAFGEVFLARGVGIKDGEEATTVMVKALQTREEHHQMEFRREIDMLTKLSHCNIVSLLGLCREAEPQLMITEYLDWVSDERIATFGLFRDLHAFRFVKTSIVNKQVNKCCS